MYWLEGDGGEWRGCDCSFSGAEVGLVRIGLGLLDRSEVLGGEVIIS